MTVWNTIIGWTQITKKNDMSRQFLGLQFMHKKPSCPADMSISNSIQIHYRRHIDCILRIQAQSCFSTFEQ